MKKLLSLLSAGILTLTGVGSVVSCSQKGTTIMEDIQEELSQNTEIIETIEKESLKIFNTFWERKQIIDISQAGREEMKPSFNNLVNKVKQEAKQGPVVINSENFDQYRMINDFYNDFKFNFDQLNVDLAKRYSNYFGNEKPLVLDPQDVIFTGNFINFEELQKFGGLVKDIKAVTVTYEIKYSIRFKGQYNPVKMDGAMTITDDYDHLKNTSNLVSNHVINALKTLYEGRDNNIVLDLPDRPNDISLNTIKEQITSKVKDCLTDEFSNTSIIYLGNSNHMYEIGNIEVFETLRYRWRSIIALQKYNEGKLPDGITADDFVDWYIEDVLPTNSLLNDKFPDEKVWFEHILYNNKIVLAGLPLQKLIKSGGVFNRISVSIKKADLKRAVKLFASKVIDFYKMYQIESYWTKTIFYLPKHLFSEVIKIVNVSEDRSSLREILRFIVNDYNKSGKIDFGGGASDFLFTKEHNFLRKINIEDSIIFQFDGEQQNKLGKHVIGIWNKNNLRLGLVHVGVGSQGNQIEFKLKL